jgi:hypothetical protein
MSDATGSSFLCGFGMMNSYPFTFLSSVLASWRSTRIRACSGHRTVERIPARQLRLQAGLDEELSARRARCVANVLSNDPDARQLRVEFSRLKSILAGNELERQVPQAREDYWRGILKVIAQQADGCDLQHTGAR